MSNDLVHDCRIESFATGEIARMHMDRASTSGHGRNGFVRKFINRLWDSRGVVLGAVAIEGGLNEHSASRLGCRTRHEYPPDE